MVNMFLSQNQDYSQDNTASAASNPKVNFLNTNKLHAEEPSSDDDTFDLLESKQTKNEKGILDSSSSEGEEDLLNLS